MFCTQCNKFYDKKNIAYCPIHGRKLIKDPKEALIGRVIDNKYRIEAEIGEGGTGVVYRARHVKLDMMVAIKILHKKFTNDSVAVERFRREAYAAMQIRHPNAIAVMDFGITDENYVYVVMEFLVGITLRDKLEEVDTFSLSEAYAIIRPVCEAVHVAHRIGIVHRDLKPENIFLDNSKPEEVVKVLDFGIARMTGSTVEQRGMRLTQEGVLIGTPHYMSPEQCYGRDVDACSDVYSLGIILYEMLTGVLPFDDRSLSLVAVKQAREKAQPLYAIKPEIPAIVNAVVMHALEKKPENRPVSVLAFAQELEAAVRVVNEKEFQSVFLNASDEDLEAALLLANNPLERLDKLDQRRYSRKTDAPERISRRTEKTRALEEATKTKPLDISPLDTFANMDSSSAAAPNSQSLPTMLDQISLDQLSLQAEQIEETTEELYSQLLILTREAPILMQIVAADIEAKKSLDPLFLSEMKASIDHIRHIIYKLERRLSAPKS